METEYDPSNDQHALLKRFVVEQGAEIMILKHNANNLLTFIEVEQDVNDVDVDVNETCFSISTAEKWSERLIKDRDKSKTLTSNISSADVTRTKVTTVEAGAGAAAGAAAGVAAGAGPTTNRQSDSLKDKTLSAAYLALSSK